MSISVDPSPLATAQLGGKKVIIVGLVLRCPHSNSTALTVHAHTRTVCLPRYGHGTNPQIRILTVAVRHYDFGSALQQSFVSCPAHRVASTHA